MQNRYLIGENKAPRKSAEAKLLIGKKVKYLREIDIDKSGRGYYFPQVGFVDGVVRREIIISGDYISFRSIREIEILECHPQQ